MKAEQQDYNYYFRKPPTISIYEIAKDEARRFCSETGLHGFQFISMKGNTPTERFIWTFISFGALILALTLSTMSWVYSTAIPTVIVTDSMQHPISSFLYPGISVCNLNKISKRRAYEFVHDKLKVDNASYWQDRMQLLIQMYFAHYETTDSKAYNQLQDLLDTNNITAESALVQVSPSCNDFLQTCSWKANKVRCDSIFQEQRTPEGTCCTFNHYALKNRVFSGYMADRYASYPRKLASCGDNSGLNVLIYINPNDYLVSEISAYGAKVLIHDTYDYPDWSSQRVLIPMARLVYVDINPSKTYATEEVRAMNLATRGCIFTDERKLTLYSNYSIVNCLAECRIRILEKVCGCMPFYLRNEWANWSRPLRTCNLRDIACISANKQRFLSSVPGYDAYRTRSSIHVWGTEESECNCPPSCESRIYNVHSTNGRMYTPEMNNEQQFFGGKSSEEHSSINIFFKDLTAKRMKRDVSISWSAIFGLFGGLLGLCLGFTFIAVFDVIYTFTIRLGINVYKKKKELARINNQMSTKPKQKIFHRQNLSFNVLPVVDNPKRTVGNQDNGPMVKLRREGDIWFIN